MWMFSVHLELGNILGGEGRCGVTAAHLRHIIPRCQTHEGVETLPGGGCQEEPSQDRHRE